MSASSHPSEILAQTAHWRLERPRLPPSTGHRRIRHPTRIDANPIERNSLWRRTALIVGYALFSWAMVANALFATLVRFQSQRGHAQELPGYRDYTQIVHYHVPPHLW
jgi:hypothetical protein